MAEELQPGPTPNLSFENSPVGYSHLKITTVLGLGYLFDFMDIMLFSFAVVPIAGLWRLANLQVGLLFSTTFAGMLVGAVLAGTVADKFGRKIVFQYNLLLFSLSTLGVAFAADYSQLALLRFAAGIGLGGEIPVAYTLLEEVVPAKTRGRVVSLFGMFPAAGTIVAAALAVVVIPSFGWRALLVLGGAPALIVWFARRGLPESSRWLETRKQEEIKTAANYVTVRRPRVSPTLKVLFSQRYARRTTMLWVLWFLGFGFAFWGLQSWLPGLLVARGFTLIQSFSFIAIIGVGGLVANGVGAFALDGVGRRKLMSTAFAASALLAYFFSTADSTFALVVFGFIMYVAVFSALGVGLLAYTPELYPTRIRATGVGAASAMLRIGAIVSPIVIGFLLGTVGVIGAFWVIVGSLLASALVIAVFGEETRRRTLEEISPHNNGDG